MLKRVAMAVFVALSGAAAASAQTPPAGQQPATQQPATTGQQSSSPSTATETRPATTTYMGDTGLWFVPTADILPAKKWSFSAYRVNFDTNEGFSDVSDWPVTIGVGLADRAEIFGAWSLVRRIDRDVRPIFTGTQGGGTANEYPFVRQGWSGQPARRSLARRQDQPDLAVAAAAGGLRAARHDQDADRQRRRGRSWQRQDGLGLRRDRQQGVQPARRALGLRRLHRPR